MAYDKSSYDMLGSNYPPLPLASGALHVKLVNTPMNPGLLVRAFEKDPYNLTTDVETNMGQNKILTSGTTLPANNPGTFFSTLSQQDYETPRVVPEFSLLPGSGLPGTLGDAYPVLTHNIGLGPDGSPLYNK